jgi:hypothetical protein
MLENSFGRKSAKVSTQKIFDALIFCDFDRDKNKAKAISQNINRIVCSINLRFLQNRFSLSVANSRFPTGKALNYTVKSGNFVIGG